MTIADDRTHPAPQGSLRSRALRSGGLVFGQMAAQQGLRLLSNLVMTRLLVPEAFGLIAFVSTLIVAFALFSDIGLEKNIIREKDGDSAKFLRVAWVIKILRGVLIASCVSLVALGFAIFGTTWAPVGTVYSDPILPLLILVSALFPLLQGLEATTKELSLRRLEMGRITVVELTAQAITIGTMVAFAAINPTVWALMAGMLVGQLVRSGGSFLFYPGPRMAFEWDQSIFLRIWHFGKWLLGSSVFTFFANNADRFILAGLMSSLLFGIYAIARIWVDAGKQILGRIAGQVGFSSIGEVIRDRPKDAPRFFRKVQTALDVLCVIGFLVCYFASKPFVELLYTEDYSSAGEYLQVLGLILLVARFDQLNLLVMNIGNSQSMMVISAIRALALCISLPLSFFTFGIYGALFAVTLSPLLSVPYALLVLRSFLGRQILIDVTWTFAILAIAGAMLAF